MKSFLHRTPRLVEHLFSKITWRLPPQKKGPLLTFDDGPHPSSTPQLLELLNDLDMKAEFFVLGKYAERWPELIDGIVKKGHVVSSHGYDHLDGWRTSTKAYLDNAILGCQISQTKRFRPPFGRITPMQYRRMKHLEIVMWSYMAGDFSTNCSAQIISHQLKKNTTDTDIIVFHDSPKVIDKVQSALLLWQRPAKKTST